jgi:hypothetical protein
MSRQDDEPEAASTLAPLNELVRSTLRGPSRQRLAQGFDALSARLEQRRTRRALTRPTFAAALACAAAALVALAIFVLPSLGTTQGPAPLTYTVEGGSMLDGGYLQGSRRDPLTMAFSEGSRVTFTPGSHGRLQSVDSAGAHISVESGTAYFEVTPRVGSHWTVDVGPFLVKVQGTVFTASWDVAHERFDLRLERGRVAVSGPASGGDIVLREGQRLVVDLPTAQTLITEDKGTESRAAASPGNELDSSPTAQTSSDPMPLSAPSLAGTEPPPTKARPSWSDAVAAADWERILREAEAAGIPQTLAHASADDLMALADAARYHRRTELARDALLALRKRFPSSPRSLQAAYHLGRVYEASPSGVPDALRWYDEYLAGAPGGAFASEALGRKMVLNGKLGQEEQTRSLAEEYLRRFPKGTYAGSARALLQAD